MYVYQKHLAGEVTLRERELGRRGPCKARVKLDRNNAFLQEVNDNTPTHPPTHTHPHTHTQIKVEVVKVKASIKRQAETSLDTLQQIITGELEGISEAAAVSLPLMNSIRRNIRLQRHRNESPNPSNRADISVLPQMYMLTSTVGQFLRYDSAIRDDERILMFATDQGLEPLSNLEHWFCDSTFKVCPEILYQVYSIHTLDHGRVLPCLFALLTNKNQQTYKISFREISNLAPGILQDIVFDFERPAMNTMQLLLPNVEIKDFLSFIQERYNVDPKFSLHLQMLAALAFVLALPLFPRITSFSILNSSVIAFRKFMQTTAWKY